MDRSAIIYLLDSYMLLLDEGEEFNQIVHDFVSGEMLQFVHETVVQLKELLDDKEHQKENLKAVLDECIAYTGNTEDALQILKDTLTRIEETEQTEQIEQTES